MENILFIQIKFGYLQSISKIVSKTAVKIRIKTNKSKSLIKKYMNMEIDVRTPIEKVRDEKHQKICNDFLSLIAQRPDCKAHRIFSLLSQKYTMTVPGVKEVIVRNGLYKTTSRK